MTEGRNFSGQVTPSIIDTEYVRCNFSLPYPVDSGGGVLVGVRLFPGDDTPRTFTRCNLINCEPPPGSTVIDCLTSLITTSTVVTEIIIDGEPLGDVFEETRSFAGRWTPGGYEYP
jgi:hypothetical protein